MGTPTARKSDQSEVVISGQLANQNPGKRTNQKAGYKKKQPESNIGKILYIFHLLGVL
jgi:hypothetical protein